IKRRFGIQRRRIFSKEKLPRNMPNLDLEKGMLDCPYAKCYSLYQIVMAEPEKLCQKYRVALSVVRIKEERQVWDEES
ncbi:hypothetical protein ABKV19_027358, partial [Rosa sericea]